MDLIEARKICLFTGLSNEDLELAVNRGETKVYSKGEFLLNQEDSNGAVFFLLEGAVRIFRINKEGREQVLAYIKSGDVFNLPTAFLEKPHAPAFAQAMCHIKALIIPLDAFRTLVNNKPAFALAVMRDLSQKLEYMTNLVHDLSLLDVRSRLAGFLLDKHAKPDPATRWTHEKIALQIGTSREVVSRILKTFANEGLIIMERGKLQVTNEPELRKIRND